MDRDMLRFYQELGRYVINGSPTLLSVWDIPFPMGVFGTLRKGHGNSRLMRGNVNHYKAFLPHFVAKGLSINYNAYSTAPFEIYTYSPEAWKKMIKHVDGLEGFTPSRMSDWGYHRTLALLRVLPDKFKHHLFPEQRPELSGSPRNLEIPEDEWREYDVVPCWIYSSIRENSKLLGQEANPVIWDGKHNFHGREEENV